MTSLMFVLSMSMLYTSVATMNTHSKFSTPIISKILAINFLIFSEMVV